MSDMLCASGGGKVRHKELWRRESTTQRIVEEGKYDTNNCQEKKYKRQTVLQNIIQKSKDSAT